MSDTQMIYSGGILNIIGILGHLAFWKLLGWKKELQAVSEVNRRVMQLLNIATICMLALFAWVSFVHPEPLVDSRLGLSLLGFISGTFLIRIIAGIAVGELKERFAVGIVAFCLLLAGAYGIPLVRTIWSFEF